MVKNRVPSASPGALGFTTKGVPNFRLRVLGAP